MKVFLTKVFEKDYGRLSELIQKQCDKQIFLLLKSPHHPSLRTSKIQGFENIWEGRITREYRFSFQITEDIYIIRRVGNHDKVLRKP